MRLSNTAVAADARYAARVDTVSQIRLTSLHSRIETFRIPHSSKTCFVTWKSSDLSPSISEMYLVKKVPRLSQSKTSGMDSTGLGEEGVALEDVFVGE